MRRVKFILTFIIMPLFLLYSCSDNENVTNQINEDEGINFLDEKYVNYPISTFLEIPRKDRYLYVDYAYILRYHDIDSSGHLNVMYQEQRSYHPVRMLAFATAVAQGYLFTTDTLYNYVAFNQLEALFERSARINDGIYFQYDFDFELHGFEDQLLSKGWSSGMAQGYGLYVLSQLYRNTNDSKYLTLADSIVNTFVNIRQNSSEKWTTYLDNEGYFWISEYPMDDGIYSQAL